MNKLHRDEHFFFRKIKKYTSYFLSFEFAVNEKPEKYLIHLCFILIRGWSLYWRFFMSAFLVCLFVLFLLLAVSFYSRPCTLHIGIYKYIFVCTFVHTNVCDHLQMLYHSFSLFGMHMSPGTSEPQFVRIKHSDSVWSG